MDEIRRIADRVSVLRDGRLIETGPVAELSVERAIQLMVGRDTLDEGRARAKTIGGPVLRVEGLTRGSAVRDVTFEARRGEILGIAGLMGAGRSELAETLCGLRPATQGTVRLNGKALSIRKYSDALHEGIAYLSEDRKAAGVYLDLPIAQNISSMALRRVSSAWGLLQRSAEHRLARELGAKLNLKSDGVAIEVSSLSGGNQQKVAIAKLLATNPSVLLMDEPTRGVDVGAKSEIHHILRELANQGVGVIVISSELPEIIGLCDRALVIRDGRLAGELNSNEMTEEALLRLASGLCEQEMA
jgi:ribose transport system ATP-binding protein